jgi:hypothetical protein
LSHELSRITKKHLGVWLSVFRWRHVTIRIVTRHLIQASKTWEKEYKNAKDGAKEFVEKDNNKELKLDTFCYIIV